MEHGRSLIDIVVMICEKTVNCRIASYFSHRSRFVSGARQNGGIMNLKVLYFISKRGTYSSIFLMIYLSINISTLFVIDLFSFINLFSFNANKNPSMYDVFTLPTWINWTYYLKAVASCLLFYLWIKPSCFKWNLLRDMKLDFH